MLLWVRTPFASLVIIRHVRIVPYVCQKMEEYAKSVTGCQAAMWEKIVEKLQIGIFQAK
jgi:hypothetical protein